MARKLRIGTRGSKLALAQTDLVRSKLINSYDSPTFEEIEIVVVRTTGDRITDRTLADIGGKGLFVKELEEALLNGYVDLAVHSMKDMETKVSKDLIVPSILVREDPRDVLISAIADEIFQLPQKAVVGTSSQRRGAQLRLLRPDLEIIMLRGNIDTRLGKLERGEVEAIFLARAGLVRLGLTERVTATIDPSYMLPAAGQGAIGVQCRAEDEYACDLIKPLNDSATYVCISCERAVLAALDGTCHTPIAAYACINNGALELTARVLRPDGTEMHEATRNGLLQDAIAMGRDAGNELRGLAGPDFF